MRKIEVQLFDEDDGTHGLSRSLTWKGYRRGGSTKPNTAAQCSNPTPPHPTSTPTNTRRRTTELALDRNYGPDTAAIPAPRPRILTAPSTGT